jgi:hypothetical protein
VKKICAAWGDPIFDLPATVVMTQQGIDRFTVHYGKQVDSSLDYAEAAFKFGCAVMHAAACNGHLDNRERRKKRA